MSPLGVGSKLPLPCHADVRLHFPMTHNNDAASMNLKTELKQLSEGANVAIPIDFSVLSENSFWSVDIRTIRSDGSAGPAASPSRSHPHPQQPQPRSAGSSPPKRAATSTSDGSDIADTIWEQTSITYGQLRQLIEHVLHKKGYYDAETSDDGSSIP